MPLALDASSTRRLRPRPARSGASHDPTVLARDRPAVRPGHGRAPLGAAQGPSARAARPDPRLEALKTEALAKVEGRAQLIQQMVDQVYSFGELGMQEFETSKYLTGVLEQNGFTVERGTAGMPTAWLAKWGSGKPVISLGSDIDGIPQANQKPAFGYREPLVAGAPGHGEGHNSGQAVNIAAALVVKEIMEREKIPGTLMLWPGIAEEQLAGKAHLVRAGVFKDVDVTLFTHVGSELGVAWGRSGTLALVSALFKFRGQTAHSAGAPWRGKSALDAVMLMGCKGPETYANCPQILFGDAGGGSWPVGTGHPCIGCTEEGIGFTEAHPRAGGAQDGDAAHAVRAAGGRAGAGRHHGDGGRRGGHRRPRHRRGPQARRQPRQARRRQSPTTSRSDEGAPCRSIDAGS